MSDGKAQPTEPPMPCSVDECGKDAFKARLCYGHYQRKCRGQPVNTPLRERGRTDWQRLVLAFENFADVAERVGVKDSDVEWRRAEWRLEYAIQAYRRRALSRQTKRSDKERLHGAVVRIAKATRRQR